jgi:dCTP deaminase
MILTGSEIEREVKLKNIIIKPFNKSQINPNSYNYRIGTEILVQTNNGFVKKKIPVTGFVLKPHQVYLAHTYEILGSNKYAMNLIGRSSLGRLGLFLQISANLGHTGSSHRWTLELVSTMKLKIYPHMIIGQISFWKNKGTVKKYTDGYSSFNRAKESLVKIK